MPQKLLSKLLNRTQIEEPYVRPSLDLSDSDSIASIASDATAPNNPGPGRNLGRLYDALGSRLEQLLTKRAAREFHTPLSLQLAPLARQFKSDSTESIASDATGPNNPGPGRNLGLLLDNVGGRIERFVNGAAGRLGLGPQALFESILSLRRYEGNLHRKVAAPTEQEYCVYKKLSRKLLKHCKSHVLATQLEALEVVTVLATEDPYIRQVLAGVLHKSYLVPRYKEQDLRIASSKALISIKDHEVHEFWFDLNQCVVSLDGRKYEDLEKQFESFIRDPDTSFLAGRLLLGWSDVRDSSIFLFSIPIHEAYFEVARDTPHIIEYETCIKILKKCEETGNTLSADLIMQVARHFPILHLYQHGTSSAQILYHRMNSSVNLEEIADNSWRILRFLDKLCGSEDPREQLLYLRNMDKNTRKLAQGTVFGNDILIIWAHIAHGSGSVMSYEFETSVMASYFIHGNSDERAVVKTVISESIGCTRYFKYALFNLVLQCIETPLEDLLSLSPAFRTVPIPSDPLYGEYGTHDHITYGYLHIIRRGKFAKNNNIAYGEGTDMHGSDTLAYSACRDCFSQFHAWLKVNGDERPFDVNGHFPVLAGLDATGKEIYVAKAGRIHTYVSNNAGNISIADSDGEVRTFTRFEVLVLRHDPCDVGVPHIPAGAKFQTGPTYWICDEEGLFARNRVITDFLWDQYPEMSTQSGGTIEELAGTDERDSRSSEVRLGDGFEDETESDSAEIVVPLDNRNGMEGCERGATDTNPKTDMEVSQARTVDYLTSRDEGPEGTDSLMELRRSRQVLEEQQRQLEDEHRVLTDRITRLEERELEDPEAASITNLKHLSTERD